MDIAVSNTENIVKELEGLTPELIQEVIDFIEFLKIKRMMKTGINHSSLLLQQESLSRIWAVNLRIYMNYKKGDIVVVKFPFILKEREYKINLNGGIILCLLDKLALTKMSFTAL